MEEEKRVSRRVFGLLPIASHENLPRRQVQHTPLIEFLSRTPLSKTFLHAARSMIRGSWTQRFAFRLQYRDKGACSQTSGASPLSVLSCSCLVDCFQPSLSTPLVIFAKQSLACKPCTAVPVKRRRRSLRWLRSAG